MVRVADVVALLQRIAPRHLAEEWDNVGLLLGDPDARARRVMTCLTVTAESAAEAVERKADLIVSHHPVLFRPVQRLTREEPQGRMLLDLIAAGVGIASAHTAYDSAAAGINQQWAERLGLIDVEPLRAAAQSASGVPPHPSGPDGKLKVVVFVPSENLEAVAAAMFAAGAGVIGEYSECSFRVRGMGTFFGSEAAQPAVGQKGRREEVEEYRLEVICPRAALAAVLAALRRAHPYEEPAFDVYPLESVELRSTGARAVPLVGAGRAGNLARATALGDFVRRVKRALGVRRVQTVGDGEVRRVAIACGAGASFLDDAQRAGCHVLVTGEARFHDCLHARALGIAVVLVGHFASERFAVETLAETIGRELPSLAVWASQAERDPLAWV